MLPVTVRSSLGQEEASQGASRPQVSWRAGCWETGMSGSGRGSCKSTLWATRWLPTPRETRVVFSAWLPAIKVSCRVKFRASAQGRVSRG